MEKLRVRNSVALLGILALAGCGEGRSLEAKYPGSSLYSINYLYGMRIEVDYRSDKSVIDSCDGSTWVRDIVSAPMASTPPKRTPIEHPNNWRCDDQIITKSDFEATDPKLFRV